MKEEEIDIKQQLIRLERYLVWIHGYLQAMSNTQLPEVQLKGLKSVIEELYPCLVRDALA